MLLVESSVWIDFFNGKVTLQTLYLRDEVKRHEILLGDLILCEVLQGFRSDSEFLKARQLLLSFPCQNISGPVLALQTAQNYRYLRTKGVTVRKTIDMMIATFMEEIDNASEMKANQLRNLIIQVKPTILLLEPTVGHLADAYLTNQVLPPKAFADAQQIAVATVNELDYIVSWNLRHIANVHRQTRVNAINWLNGYTKPLQMITPIEVSYDNFETG